SIVISPLKRLQTNQVTEITEAFGLSAISINEDTPDDGKSWKMIEKHRYRLWIISPEQLGSHNGHLARFANLLDSQASFREMIRYLHIDEGHNIWSAGIPRYGEKAFRPAYGCLGKMRAILGNKTVFQLLSAMFPCHVLAAAKLSIDMAPDVTVFQGPLLRSNLAFATMPLIGNLENFSNLDFLTPMVYDPAKPVPKTLVFVDNRSLADRIAVYLNNNSPSVLRNRGFARHYHSGMSREYLDSTYEAFASPDGNCKILVATSGAATGIDIRDVTTVVQYGICPNMADALQRGGRAGRDDKISALFLTMIEDWVYEFEISELDDSADPDVPVNTKLPGKDSRVGRCAVRYAQTKTCLRKFWAIYLGDESAAGLISACLSSPHRS
ncbi:P-loop containing nucleoside triphosphate hydrolase protein, partial [Neolentinus lepideus HHB14362 ss-1]